VWDEYVSVEGARRDYGVVITGTVEAMDLALDLPATEALRQELREKRGNGS
jgi:N-methylhydantoinase B